MLLVDRLSARDREDDTGSAEATLPVAGVFCQANGLIVPEYFIEVAAQAMAAVNGYDALCDGKGYGGGFLVGVDELSWHGLMKCGSGISVEMRRQMQVGPISLISFAISGADRVKVAEGCLRTWEAP